MANYRAAITRTSTQTQRWATTPEQSGSIDRDLVCAQDGHPLGDATPRNGVWQRDDVLAAIARLAGSWGVGTTASGFVGTLVHSRADRLVPGMYRCRQCTCPRGGEKTGPNPTDRRKSVSKRHLVVDRRGIPLAVRHTAANVNDITMLLEMVDAIPQLPGPDGQLRNRPDKLHADRGYDSNKHRQALEDRGIRHRLGRRRIDQGVHLGKHRWVVERSLAWLNRYRRLRVRYERRGDIHQAFLSLGCALICWKFVQRFC